MRGGDREARPVKRGRPAKQPRCVCAARLRCIDGKFGQLVIVSDQQMVMNHEGTEAPAVQGPVLCRGPAVQGPVWFRGPLGSAERCPGASAPQLAVLFSPGCFHRQGHVVLTVGKVSHWLRPRPTDLSPVILMLILNSWIT